MDKTSTVIVEPFGDSDEVKVIRCETYAPVALDGTVRSSFNMKDTSVIFNRLHQYVTVVGKKQTAIIPVTNISFMHI